MGMFTFEIPNELHQEFKIIGIRRSKDMRDMLVELISKYIKENPNLLKVKEKIDHPIEQEPHIQDETKEAQADLAKDDPDTNTEE